MESRPPETATSTRRPDFKSARDAMFCCTCLIRSDTAKRVSGAKQTSNSKHQAGAIETAVTPGRWRPKRQRTGALQDASRVTETFEWPIGFGVRQSPGPFPVPL